MCSMFQISQSLVAGLLGMLFKEPVIQRFLLFSLVLLLCGFFSITTQILGNGKRTLPASFGLGQQSFCIEAINHFFR